MNATTHATQSPADQAVASPRVICNGCGRRRDYRVGSCRCGSTESQPETFAAGDVCPECLAAGSGDNLLGYDPGHDPTFDDPGQFPSVYCGECGVDLPIDWSRQSPDQVVAPGRRHPAEPQPDPAGDSPAATLSKLADVGRLLAASAKLPGDPESISRNMTDTQRGLALLAAAVAELSALRVDLAAMRTPPDAGESFLELDRVSLDGLSSRALAAIEQLKQHGIRRVDEINSRTLARVYNCGERTTAELLEWRRSLIALEQWRRSTRAAATVEPRR